MAHDLPSPLFILFFFLAFCLSGNGVFAFGAGNIPSFAYMEGRAFRHGDIEDVLADLIKKGAAAGGGFALSSLLHKGAKFNGLDIKRVYFGNWLRDYSQAVDIASLKKVQFQTIINLCMVLGFMAHGYATKEFEVTPERLGVYLPVEHIDNPKGYGAGEDPRSYHPQLRGPVDHRELEIDPRTGMKNYIANESGGWDTSKTHVRRILERCIHFGRQHRARGEKADEYEAYRLLGTLLHTLEDFPAHSNFCELALVALGHQEVFCHVGDQVKVQAPNGRWVAPIVTGTFGSDDFFHSLLGEATDHISSASVSDINREVTKARSKSQSQTRGPGGPPVSPADAVRDLLSTIPGGNDNETASGLDNIERIRAGQAAGGKNPEDMSPQELHSVLWQVLTWRDGVAKKISKTIEKIPGLGPMIEKFMESLSIFVFTTLEPFLNPIIKSSTGALQSISGEVINSHDQFEVFNDPRASDPTHSFLSKDHFNLILNEPAGQLARVIVMNTVKAITKAWDDPSVNVHQVTEEITACMFHPDFHDRNSQVQREMLQYMKDWIGKSPNQSSIIKRLNKQSTRNHENIRAAGEGGAPAAQGSSAASHAHGFQSQLAQSVPAFGQAQSFFAGAGQSRDGSYPNAAPGPQSHGYGPPTPAAGGQSGSFYGDAKPPISSYGSGGYNPGPTPPGSGLGFPGASPGGPPQSPSGRPGYSPAYGGPPPSGMPGGSAPHSFPGASPFPGPSPFTQGEGGYGAYGGPPSFPGGAPDPYGHGHGHGHGHGAGPGPGGPFGFPQDGGYNPGGPPSFPGSGPGFPGGAPGGGPGFPDSAPGFPGESPYGRPGGW